MSGSPVSLWIGVIGNGDVLSGGNVGNDTIWSIGDTVSVSDTTPGGLFGAIGNNDTISAGPGGNTIWLNGNNEVINGGSGNDLIGFTGDNSSISGGAGNDTVYNSGNNDTVTGGGNSLIEWSGTNHTFLDNTSAFNDTVVGFDHSAGDTIKLTGGDTVAHTTSVGGDTLITLSTGSTILLKYVDSVDNSFFS